MVVPSLICQTRLSDVEQDNDVIPETVIKFLQTVLTGKTEYSQPLKIVEQVTSWRNWWQDQTTKTNHVNPCNQVQGNTNLMRSIDQLGCCVSKTHIS